MARNKDSRFNAIDGLDFGLNSEKEKKEIPGTKIRKEIGTTQGKKGMKLKRITVSLSDDNYDYISQDAKRLGITMTAYINQVLDLYREEH